MCGLAGFFNPNAVDTEEEMVSQLAFMADAIVHRGPDSFGYWVDATIGFGLAHRRLAVLDVTENGHQPMVSKNGRYIIAFNGEIYNHMSLRKVLSAEHGILSWRGNSDTETLLSAIEVWGIRNTLENCIGMFAFAVWDREKRELVLARDRIGEKPMYYGWQGEGKQKIFLFGSDLSALKRNEMFSAQINRHALGLYVQRSYVPSPLSIYSEIKKLESGNYLIVNFDKKSMISQAFWSLKSLSPDIFIGGNEWQEIDVVDELDRLLTASVNRQMISDVPLGAFLSGGIDSSTVVAIMQALSSKQINTFTIGFDDIKFNEATYAQAIANYLGTSHNEFYVSSKDALDVIPKLPSIYSEPFADSSQIPTYLVSSLAAQKVTVSLSGDGGDELFGGYNRYVYYQRYWGAIDKLPLVIRRFMQKLLFNFPSSSPSFIFDCLRKVTPSRYSHILSSDLLHKLIKVLAARDSSQFYTALVNHWDPVSIVRGYDQFVTSSMNQKICFPSIDTVQEMMLHDALNYLPDDILTKLDFAAMSVSLETRTPFLDQKVVEFAAHLPTSYKIRGGTGKWALRQVLARYIPDELFERRKHGFGIPLGRWLRGPLRDWAETLLSEERLLREGFFNPTPIRKKLAEHMEGRNNWEHHLWDILMFQSWFEAQSID